MDAPLNVLILEDRPADAELMVAELRKAGFAPEWRRVDTERDYLAALDPGLDVILSDHSLPQYDSVRALERLQERGLDVPFIIVSGTIGEELAVGLMKQGAADYVWKDRMGRLGQAVLQALQKKHLRQDKRRVEQALRDEQAWFRALTEKIHDGVLVVDATGVLTFASPSCFSLMGYDPEQLVGTNAFGLDHPEDLPALRQAFVDLLADPEGTARATGRVRHADGTWRWLEFVGTNRLAEPPINGVVLTYRDVTEHKLAEQKLLLQGAALDAAANSIVITDRQGDIIWINDAFARLTGYSLAEVRGKNPRVLKSGKQDPAYYENLWSTILAGKVWHNELINRRKDGSLYTEELTITPVRASGNAITHFIAIKQDVTERRQAVEALRQSEQHFRSLFDNMLNGFAYCHTHFQEGRLHDWTYLEVNPAFGTLTGLANVIGKRVTEILPGIRETDPELFELYGRVVLSGKSERAEIYSRALAKWLSLSLYSPDKDHFVAIFDVITDRKQAEESLRESEKRFALAVEGANDGIWDWSLLTNEVYFSPHWKSMLGYADDELESRQEVWKQHVHPDDYADTLAQLADYLEGRRPTYQPEFRMRHKDGSYRWILGRAVVVRDASDKPIRLVGSHTDITKRKQAEAEICTLNAELEQKVRDRTAQLEAANAKIREDSVLLKAVSDAQSRFIQKEDPRVVFETLLDALCSLTGSEYGFIGEVLFATDGRPYHVIQAITNIAWNDETRALYPKMLSGELRFDNLKTLFGAVLTTAAPVIANDAENDPRRGGTPPGHPPLKAFLGLPLHVGKDLVGIVGLANVPGGYSERTIAYLEPMLRACANFIMARRSEQRRRQAEESLRLANAYNRSLIEASLDPFVTIGSDGKITDANAEAEQITGCTRQQLIGSDFAKYFTDPEQARAGYQQVFCEGSVRNYPLDIRHGNGQVTPVLYNASVYRDQDGKVLGVFAAARDITERKAAEAELLKLNARLEQGTVALAAANKELESFAYSVSHDLRAPLRGIDGFSQALLEDYNDKLDAEGQDCLRRVRAATQRMNRLIDDILQLSRLNRSTMKCEEADLSGIARHVIADLQAADPTRHDICVDITPGLTARGDAHLLEVVLVNLLGNAWKFTSKTENARIELGVSETDGKCAFFVRDNGAGFDMANVNRLFGAFQRLHTEAEFPGTGIGLATVQRVIRRHGGEVWAEGAVGQGATFYFTLGKDDGRAPRDAAECTAHPERRSPTAPLAPGRG